jgi:hypothetical protein
MTLQRTVTIPADRRIHLDFTLPETVSVGPTTVILDFPSVPACTGALSLRAFSGASIDDNDIDDRPAPGHRLTPRQLAAIEECSGIACGILTSDDILESRREDLALEEAKWQRLYSKKDKQ